MTIIIPNLALAGYRSFGKLPQFFERFAKINLFIGRNNAGKSNVLRFLSEIYPLVTTETKIVVDALSWHLPDKPPLMVGIANDEDDNFRLGKSNALGYSLTARVADLYHRRNLDQILSKIYMEKAKADTKVGCWTFRTLPDRRDVLDTWSKAANTLNDNEIYTLWRFLTGADGGDRKNNWLPTVSDRLQIDFPSVTIQVVPAIRQIGIKGSSADGFDGVGIIERLAKLQNPSTHSQEDRKRFTEINQFVQTVIDDPEAKLEIPYERDTILVHMDGKVLPIESLGVQSRLVINALDE